MMLYNQKQICTTLEKIMASSIPFLWASVFFWEKLPISEAGTAETGVYSSIQTKKPIVICNEIFNVVSKFQYGEEEKVWFNHAVVAMLIAHDLSLFQKKQKHFLRQDMLVTCIRFSAKISVKELSNSTFILLIFCWRM